MMIVNCILYLLGIPLVIGAAMFEMICETNDNDFIDLFNTDAHVAYIVFGCIFLGIAVFMGMFIGIHAFTELHKKTKVDMLYAIPLTGRQRFFSNYLGGCLMYIVPYLVSVILGWILIFAMAPFIQFGSDSFSEFQNLGEFFHEIGRLYGMGSMGLFLLMLLYYSLSVLVTVCCGTLFESLYTNILLNCLIPGTTALIIAIICNEVGLDVEYSWQIVGFISPVGGLIYLIFLLSGELINEITANAYTFAATQTHAHEMLPSYLRWALVIVLVTAAVIVLAWQLYIRRKAEHVGKPFIYIFAYYVMLTLVTISILCLMEAEVVGPAILFSAIVYFVMEVIRRRGFKRFWVSLITYAATVAVSIGCFAVITLTDCFGRVNYVPAAAGVRSVVVEFADHSDMYNGPKYSHSTNYQLEYTDRDVISEITKLHREMVNANKQETDSMEKLKTDKKEIEGDFLFGAISNSMSVGGIVKFDKAVVELDDGYFEVMLIRKPDNLIQLQGIIDGILRRDLDREGIEFFHTKSITVYGSEDTPWTLDGEYCQGIDEVLVENVHSAIELLVPNKTH